MSHSAVPDASPPAPSVPGLGDRPGQGYRVAPSKHICAATGSVLTPGQAIVTVLVETASRDEPFLRLDFDREYWQNNLETTASSTGRLEQGRVLGLWRAAAGAASPRSNRLLDDESLAHLFEQLVEQAAGESSQEPSGVERARTVAYVYMLTLVLLRRRRLVMDHGAAGAESPGRWLRVRRRVPKSVAGASAAEAPIQIEVPSIGESELIALTDQFMRTLTGDTAPGGDTGTTA